jgi:putative aldouronate transport system substrate-binding protein
MGNINSLYPYTGLLIRSDWLEKLGLPVPRTLEELTNVARAFVERDPDGNGVKDTYGIGGFIYKAGSSVNAWFHAGSPWIVRNNELVYGWDLVRAAVEFKKMAYDSGLVDKDYLSDNNGSRLKQSFVNGKLGIYPWTFTQAQLATDELYTLRQNVPNAKVMFIPFPETSVGQYNYAVMNPIQMTTIVNAACKDPRAVIQYIDFLKEGRTSGIFSYGIEGVHHTLDAEGYPVIKDLEKFNREVGWAGDFTMIIDMDARKAYWKERDYDINNPLGKEVFDLYKSTFQIFDLNRPYPELTHGEHMPSLPSDLALIDANINTVDFLNRAIVSGSSYTVDQAMRDAQAAWERGGGKQIEEWYKNWYKNNGKDAFLARDIYDMLKQQNKFGTF